MSTGTARTTTAAADPEVSIVVPCRNEAATIGACVTDAYAALARCGYVGEVLVCDNGSTDGSVELAERAGAHVVRQTIRGYGAACLRGLEAARGRHILLADGDGTYNLAELHRFIEPLRAGYEIVLGTRRNGEIEPGSMTAAHGHVLEPIQTHLLRRFFRFRVSDVRCGMRGIQRDALERLNLGATGMEFASELLVEAARAELRAVEVPVTFRPRPEAQRRSVGDGWRVARYLLLLSPTQLFLVPGLLLLGLGLLLELALLAGPVRVGRLTFDYHFMFVGGALAILGLQVVLLGVYAKTYALVHDSRYADRWISRFHLRYTLERGVALGGVIFGAGLIINANILGTWVGSAEPGALFAVRPAMLALTLMVLGAEIIFAAFFLSVLRAAGFGRA